MERWFSPSGDWDDCDTAACAMGHFCRDPRMQAAGLEVECGLSPIVRGSPDYSAAVVLFSISYETAEYLFAPDCYSEAAVTASHVAARIRELISLHEAELELAARNELDNE